MDYLFNLGVTEQEIKYILEICPEILELNGEKIINNIEILKIINCNERHIRNIILSNPFYLGCSKDDIIDLINKLLEIGITNINLLFDSNPLLLNKNSYEIDDYIKEEIKKGKNINDIVDELECNPYIIDEI